VLSSVGLSDILPATGMARALVMLESFAGLMYMALVVSRLINLTRDRT
jgi:Ion channel